MVVAVTASGQLVSKAQTKPNGPWEADWTPVEKTHSFGVMAAGLTADGRVAVLAQPASGAGLLYIDQNLDKPNQPWNPPVDLGKPTGVTAFTYLAMAVDADARLEVFGTDTNQGIWWKYQNPSRIVKKTVTRTPPGTNTPITVTVDEIAPPATRWSDWFSIAGGLVEIKALRNADGRIILFGINREGRLYRCEQSVALALQPSDWTGWVPMDDAVTGHAVMGSMAPALDAAGAVNLFVIGRSNQILHARQAPPCTATWTGWSTPGFLKDQAQAVAVCIDGSDRLVVVANEGGAASVSNFYTMTRQLDVEAQQWSGWTAFAIAGGLHRIALDYNADGRLTFFSHFLEGPPETGLYCTSQMAFDSTEWEYEVTRLAFKDIKDYAVVRDLTPPTS